MKQREIQDHDNIRWACVEALGTVSPAPITDDNGNVTVVCTPSGGAQTIRVKLKSDWFEKATDEELLSKIRTSDQKGD